MATKKSRSAIIIDRLKLALGITKNKELADILGISANTVSSWKSRDSIDLELIVAKCESVSVDWLLRGEGEPTDSREAVLFRAVANEISKSRDEPSSLHFPVPSRTHHSALPSMNVDAPIFSDVSAGPPSITQSDYWTTLREKLGLDPNRHLIITVASDADTSSGFHEGDTVVVDMNASVRSGSWVFGSRGGRPALFRFGGVGNQDDVSVAGVVIYCFRHM
jgi:SOS-response transcriptional repressor LexA